jgi:hypothetical protein
MDLFFYFSMNFLKNKQNRDYEFKDYTPDNFSPIDFSKNELKTNVVSKALQPDKPMSRLDSLEADT